MFLKKGSRVDPATKMKWAREQRVFTHDQGFSPGLLLVTASAPGCASKEPAGRLHSVPEPSCLDWTSMDSDSCPTQSAHSVSPRLLS